MSPIPCRYKGGGDSPQGRFRPGTISPPLKSPKLQVPCAQMTATKQQDMHQTESPKVQHVAAIWSQKCVFQEEPRESTHAPEPTASCGWRRRVRHRAWPFSGNTMRAAVIKDVVKNCYAKISPGENFATFLTGEILPLSAGLS